MAYSNHGKDGRFRDSTGLISFEYDHNDPRHIQQELDHPQLGHEGQYGNCWICHDYTPRRFKTQREVDADTDRDSYPSIKRQPRYHVLLRENVATGMDPLPMQRFWPPAPIRIREPNQRGPGYLVDALPHIATREVTSSRRPEGRHGVASLAQALTSNSSSLTDVSASHPKAASRSRARGLHDSKAPKVISSNKVDDDAIAQILRRKAKIHEDRAAYYGSDCWRDAPEMVREFVGLGVDRLLEEAEKEMEGLVFTKWLGEFEM